MSVPTAGDADLSWQVVRYWGAFIASGDPTVSGQPAWPLYNQSSVSLQLKADAVGSLTGADFRSQHHRAFWGKLAGAGHLGIRVDPGR